MLSIDVGSNKVCVAEGAYRNGQVTVTSCAEIEYKSEITVNGTITDRTSLSFLINEIIKTNHMKSKNAVFSFNSSDIISREFKMPNIKLNSLQMLVKNEMSRIMGSEDAYIIDFVITGTTADKMLSVLAFAVAKETVEGYYKLLQELRLKPVALDVHANAITKLMSDTSLNGKMPDDGNIIIADIGYSKIAFHVFSSGVSRFNRTEVSPVQEFMRELGSLTRTDMTSKDMAELDLTPDFDYENTVVGDACRYFVYRLSDEIQRYIQYVMLNSSSKSVSQVYLCGGVASMKGMETALANSLKIPVETLRNIGRLNVPKDCAVSKVCNAAGALIRR